MTPCDQIANASAYHDGELAPDARRSFEAHLPTCPPCREELEELAALSQRFAAAGRQIPNLAPDGLARIHAVIDDRTNTFALLRTARALSAIAAVILVSCSVWLVRQELTQAPEQPQRPVPVTLAMDVDLAAMSSDSQAAPETQLAQWFAKDLGNSHEDK